MAETAKTPTKPASPLKTIQNFFNTTARPMKLTDMKTEWTPMPQADKDQILAGIADGTLTY